MSEALFQIINTRSQGAVACRVEWQETRPYNVIFRSPAFDDVRVTADDLFEALRMLRRLIEPPGWRILCNGARIDSWAFGLSRDWGGGEKLSILFPPGRPHHSGNALLNIFEPAEFSKVGTVNEQEEYFERWLNQDLT